jgi:hypothetical protein
MYHGKTQLLIANPINRYLNPDGCAGIRPADHRRAGFAQRHRDD